MELTLLHYRLITPALREAEAVGDYEFEASLIYVMSSRLV